MEETSQTEKSEDGIEEESSETPEESVEIEETPKNSEKAEKTEAPAEAPSETPKPQDSYAEHIKYNEEGVAIYTDPATQTKFTWSAEKNEWTPQTATSSQQTPPENEHYRWCAEKNEWILKTTPKETEYYRWCEKTNSWIPKMKSNGDVTYNYDEKEKTHTYTDGDGVVYVWDSEKSAWFPRVDDDFLAIYQLNYGFVDNTTKKEETESVKIPEVKPAIPEKSTEDPAEKPGRKRKPPPKWFDIAPEQNAKVYVSNLPLDLTEEEFIEIMSKCGLIMKDPKTRKFKLKLYRDANGELKGDGLCHYIKVESVDLALSVLDGYEIRGNHIKVERAKFEMRGEYNPALKPKLSKTEKKKLKEMQQKLFDWRPEQGRGERAKHERIVILKNLFEPSLFDEKVELIVEYQNDLREECGKCGTVRKVVIFDRHPDGVAQVTMSDPEEADLVVQLMNARFFGQRRLMATTWDGKTKYKIDETEDEKKARLDKWNDYLKSEELKREALEDAEPDEIPDPVEKMEVLEQTAEKVPAEFTENLEI
jgi:HIV Tat-specific factor 1